MSAGVPYIGSRIALISKSQIRYEGILYTIDTNESTVALKDVQSFGSENRPRPGGGPPVPPTTDVYEYIIFRVHDIADLHVITAPATAATPDPPTGHASQQEAEPTVPAQQPPHTTANGRAGSDDAASFPSESKAASTPAPHVAQATVRGQEQVESRPAMQQTQNQHHRHQQPSYRGAKPWGPPPSATASGGSGVADSNGIGAGDRGGRQPNANGAGPPSGANGYGQSHGRGGGGGAGRGGRDMQRRRGRGGGYGGGGRGRPPQPGIVIPSEDFDFDAMNEKFQKASLTTPVDSSADDLGVGVAGAKVVGLDGEGAGASQAPADLATIAVKYDKSSSFFDELESESRERATPQERAQRRNNDFETFGETHQPQYGYNRRGRGRGRGRGGRGRGRGGGYGSSGYGYGGQQGSGNRGGRGAQPSYNG